MFTNRENQLKNCRQITLNTEKNVKHQFKNRVQIERLTIYLNFEHRKNLKHQLFKNRLYYILTVNYILTVPRVKINRISMNKNRPLYVGDSCRQTTKEPTWYNLILRILLRDTPGISSKGGTTYAHIFRFYILRIPGKGFHQ